MSLREERRVLREAARVNDGWRYPHGEFDFGGDLPAAHWWRLAKAVSLYVDRDWSLCWPRCGRITDYARDLALSALYSTVTPRRARRGR